VGLLYMLFKIKPKVMKSENICSLGPVEFAFLLVLKATKSTIYTPTILAVVFNACKVWSIALRDEQRIRIFENVVQRNIFRLERKK
jgi:hypothetical protein